LALRRQRQEDLCEFKFQASQNYVVVRPAKKKKKKRKERKKERKKKGRERERLFKED
jgi:hypothetical protein